ncbi:alpha/beta fold hydrolase [Saccharopolyspora sp. NPDC000995]
MTQPNDDARPAASHLEGTLSSGQYWQGWTVDQPAGVVVLVHGVHEHSGRYRHVALRLNSAGYAVYTLDHPGHGRSPGTRGNIGSMAAAVAGVDVLARLAGQRHEDVPLFVYGHSLGGLISLQYLTGTPLDRIVGAVISAPALNTGAVSAVEKVVSPLLSKLLPGLGVRSLDANTISRDPDVVRDYLTDPLNHAGKMRARTAVEIMLAVEAMPQRLTPDHAAVRPARRRGPADATGRQRAGAHPRRVVGPNPADLRRALPRGAQRAGAGTGARRDRGLARRPPQRLRRCRGLARPIPWKKSR